MRKVYSRPLEFWRSRPQVRRNQMPYKQQPTLWVQPGSRRFSSQGRDKTFLSDKTTPRPKLGRR